MKIDKPAHNRYALFRKIFSKLVAKIRNNKTRIKKAVDIGTMALGFKYGSINLSPTNLPSNSTQQIERADTFVEKNVDMQVVSKVIKTGSKILISNQEISKGSNSALETRGGDERFWKFGPGSKARGAARNNGRKARNSNIFADGFVPQQTYCQYHKSNSPLSCKPRVKVTNDPFQGDGDNKQPPPENGNFDLSQYKGGPNPFLGKFDYDNPNHTRENTDFSSQKRMNHAYDRHAEKSFSMKENRNKENLKKFEGKARSFIESPETEKINGSYRYETPAYFYKEKDGNLVAIVNATDNSFLTIVNATKFQLESIKENHNFGLDTRPSMELRLRGPKNHN